MEKQVKDFALSHNLIIYCLKESVCQINVRENHPILNDFLRKDFGIIHLLILLTKDLALMTLIKNILIHIKLSKLITILCVVRLLVKLMLFQLESQ